MDLCLIAPPLSGPRVLRARPRQVASLWLYRTAAVRARPYRPAFGDNRLPGARDAARTAEANRAARARDRPRRSANRFSLPVRAETADGTGTARAPRETPDDPGGTPPGVNRLFPRPYVLGTVLAFRFRIGEPLSGNRASAFRDSVQGPASDAVRGGPSGRSRAPSSDRASAGPEVRGTRSSRTRVPYRREDDVISRVKLTCLTTV